jgi:hypothetical protein
MKMPRWLVILLLGASAVVVVTAPGWCWVTWPERTARQFEYLWNQNRKAEAVKLMSPPLSEVFRLRNDIENERKKMESRAVSWGPLAEPKLSFTFARRNLSDVVTGRTIAWYGEADRFYVAFQRDEAVDAGWLTTADGEATSLGDRTPEYRILLDQYRVFVGALHSLGN